VKRFIFIYFYLLSAQNIMQLYICTNNAHTEAGIETRRLTHTALNQCVPNLPTPGN